MPMKPLQWFKEKKNPTSEKIGYLNWPLLASLKLLERQPAKISPENHVKYPSIPWSQIIGMRNRLIHGYDSVDLDVLWDTIDIDLPPLIAALKKILEQE
jgi:uncharacterized protein with HEPN domain